MKYRITLLLICSLFMFHCKDDRNDGFLIDTGRVGKLLREHRSSQLDSVFMADSLVRDTTRMNLGQDGKIEVYERGGAHLLTLSPAGDTLHRIGNIRIHDGRFHTAEGISLQSTFGDIKSAYEIRKIITSLNNVLVLPKGSDVYFTISKEDLPASLRYTMDPIEAVQIPDAAPVKYMMVGWD